jgi:hypothetical protein
VVLPQPGTGENVASALNSVARAIDAIHRAAQWFQGWWTPPTGAAGGAWGSFGPVLALDPHPLGGVKRSAG